MNWLIDYSLWIRAAHIIAVISWLVGLLYLPQIFAYHSKADPTSAMSETFKTMERRLLRIIMLPSIILVFISGSLLLATPNLIDWTSGWLHLKLMLVLALASFHGLMARWYRNFLSNQNTRSILFYRVVGEVPALLMILIVILVIVKPF
jgi:putative membrane protein